MKTILQEYTPLAFRGDLVGEMRTEYQNGMTIVEMTQKDWQGDRFSRPTIRKILDDVNINSPVPPVPVRKRGTKVK